jgi:LysM repeat protein
MKRKFSILTAALLAAIVVSASMLAGPTTVAASSQYPTAPYWYAEFFDARWPTAEPVYTRHDEYINFDWGTGSPNVAVPIDNFSARWTRTINFTGGTYKFWVVHDDGVLLWIDDLLVINQWYDQPAYMRNVSGTMVPNLHFEEVDLAPGPHRIKLEYYEHGKEAVVKLGWESANTTPAGFVPPPASTLQTDGIHVVRPGEWLYKIARTYSVSVGVIIEANGLTSTRVVPGQTLIIPGTGNPSSTDETSAVSPNCKQTYTVRPGDNMYRISLKYCSSISAIAAQNGVSAPYTVHVGQVLCIP